MYLLRSIILSLFLVCNIPLLSAAEEMTHHFTVALSNARVRGCGSGVLLSDGSLISAGHVIERLCPKEDCSDLRIGQSKAIGRPWLLTAQKYRLSVLSRSLDIAVLKPVGTNALKSALKLGKSDSETPNEVMVSGYPGCKTLRSSKGTLVRETPSRYITSAKGSFGSSGSALLNKNGELIGVVTELGSIFSGVLAKTIGGNYSVNAQKIAPVLLETPVQVAKRFLAETKLLLADHNDYISTLAPGVRQWESIGFESQVKNLQRDFLDHSMPVELTELLQYNRFDLEFLLDRLYIEDRDRFDEQLLKELQLYVEALTAAAIVETRGFTHKSVDSRKISSIQKKNPFISQIIKAPYKGGYYHIYTLAALSTLFMLILFSLLGASLGYVFASQPGGIVKKVVVCFAILLFFWPLSFLVFIIRKKFLIKK